jgi:hypothetical protein
VSDYETGTLDDLPLFANCQPEPQRIPTRKPKTLSRSTDSSTSHEAADELVASGKYEKDSQDALALVLANPGRTAYELEAIDKNPSGKGYGSNRPDRIRKRLAGLADCENAMIARGPKRVCHEKGSKCLTWWPIKTLERMEG